MRPFALQLRGLASRPIPATASTLLAYIFETILRPDQARSVAALPPPLSFLRPRRVRSTHGTRCLAQSRDSWFVREPFAPLQDLSILRDQSHGPRWTTKLALQVARSSFAPRSAAKTFNDHLRYGSSFRIRYFLPGSLSFEPLGTTVIMLPDGPRRQ